MTVEVATQKVYAPIIPIGVNVSVQKAYVPIYTNEIRVSGQTAYVPVYLAATTTRRRMAGFVN